MRLDPPWGGRGALSPVTSFGRVSSEHWPSPSEPRSQGSTHLRDRKGDAISAAHPQIATRPANDGATAGDVAMELATWSTGVGVITFVLFPLLIPGIAVLALFALPLLPLALLAPFVWLPLRVVWGRATRRKESKGSRGLLRTGEQRSLVKQR